MGVENGAGSAQIRFVSSAELPPMERQSKSRSDLLPLKGRGSEGVTRATKRTPGVALRPRGILPLHSWTGSEIPVNGNGHESFSVNGTHGNPPKKNRLGNLVDAATRKALFRMVRAV